MKIIEPITSFWEKTSDLAKRFDNGFNEFLEEQNIVMKYTLKTPYYLLKNYWDLGAIILSAYSIRDIMINDSPIFGEYGKYIFSPGLMLGFVGAINDTNRLVRNFYTFIGTILFPTNIIKEIGSKLDTATFSGLFYLGSVAYDYARIKGVDISGDSLEDKVTE